MAGVSVRLAGRTILRDVNLHIHCGQMAVIIGPNGGGKTTLLRTILGELPHDGTIINRLAGSDRHLRIGYVPQKISIDPTMPATVGDLFAAALSRFPVWLGRRRRSDGEARCMLEPFHAAGLIDERIGTLSGGQLQRVLLALAMSPVPDLLLLDEPVSGVDPEGVELFYETVSSLRNRFHLAIVMVSHDLRTAARYADRMLFLDGAVLSDGTPAEVLAHPAVPRTFGSLPAVERVPSTALPGWPE
jgi:zinc transport system ATP-binding protein